MECKNLQKFTKRLEFIGFQTLVNNLQDFTAIIYCVYIHQNL